MLPPQTLPQTPYLGTEWHLSPFSCLHPQLHAHTHPQLMLCPKGLGSLISVWKAPLLEEAMEASLPITWTSVHNVVILFHCEELYCRKSTTRCNPRRNSLSFGEHQSFTGSQKPAYHWEDSVNYGDFPRWPNAPSLYCERSLGYWCYCILFPFRFFLTGTIAWQCDLVMTDFLENVSSFVLHESTRLDPRTIHQKRHDCLLWRVPYSPPNEEGFSFEVISLSQPSLFSSCTWKLLKHWTNSLRPSYMAWHGVITSSSGPHTQAVFIDFVLIYTHHAIVAGCPKQTPPYLPSWGFYSHLDNFYPPHPSSLESVSLKKNFRSRIQWPEKGNFIYQFQPDEGLYIISGYVFSEPWLLPPLPSFLHAI